MSYQNFTLPEDCCFRVLVKNLGREMPDSVVPEEQEAWTFMTRQSCSCVPAVNTRTQLSNHFIASVALGPEMSKVRSITEICGLLVWVESYVNPKGPL